MPRIGRAPTFSWPAVDDCVAFHRLSDLHAHVDSIAINFDGQNPYGKPKNASLKITSPLRQAWSCGPFTIDLINMRNPRKAGFLPLYGDDGWPIGHLWPDSKDDADERDVHCLQLEDYLFLALAKVPTEESTSKFRRIGLGFAEDGTIFSEASVQTVEIILNAAKTQ